MVLVGAIHDAILDAKALQARPPRLERIGTVAIDRALVAADQFVGDLALVDRGRGDHHAPNQARALVDPDMRLVAEHGLAAAAGPAGIRLLRMDRTAPCRHRRRLALRADDRGIHHRVRPQQQPLRLQLRRHQRKALLQHPRLRRIMAEAQNRGLVRRAVLQREPAKSAKRQAVAEHPLQVRIGEVVKPL